MRIRINAGVFAAWTVASVLAGYWYSRHIAGNPANLPARQVLYYHDPMHPSYRSDKPGVAPDCGMPLEPVYAGAAVAADQDPTLPAGAVHIDTGRQQAIGVKLGRVETTAGRETVRLLGRVAADEDRVFRIVSGTDGWNRETYPNSAGTMVKKDELLATFYAREFLTAQQSYFFALTSLEHFKTQGENTPDLLKVPTAQLHQAEENLQAMGMCDLQITAIAKSREASRNIEIRAPVDGLVLVRNVFKGQRFDRNTELYRIADLNQVWIQADVFENDRRVIRPDQIAHIRYQGRTLPARVSQVPPQFDTGERTLKLRLEAANPGHILRPGMFVDVEFAVDLPKAVTVPADAVLDSGLRNTVFVASGNGYFEPRAVETGWRFGDRVEIVRGLQVGESIVISGNFLIDSESRMKATGQPGVPPTSSAAANRAVKDPSCGMELDPAKAAGKSEYLGKTYYFCSKSCKEMFDKDPKKYGDPKQMAQL
jgi:RND family efflux transporter MFP subunit